VENRPSPEFGWNKPYEHTLVTLREGHFFGEMALVTNEPRVASVVSVSKLTICLVLAKKDFRAALSDETFGEVLSEVLAKRKTIRAQRESNAEESTSQIGSPGSRDSLGGSSVGGSSNNSVSSRRNSGRRRTATSPSTPHSGEVSVSTTLSMRKLESGSRVVNKYIVERELGKGSFGDVYLCKDQETGEQYAMKMINRPQSSWNDDASSSIKQEIAVMKRLQHNNIVNLHEVIDDQNARKIFLIQEFMEGGPLMADAETCEPVDISLARKYFRDILRGVCYLHSEGIIHRDIKPQNMLLSADGTVKIADFGAAVFTTANEKVAYGGTPAFMAPELFLTNSTIDFTKNEGIDVFALGATLYFMLCGKPPWMAKNQLDLATKIKNIELTFPTTTIDPHVKVRCGAESYVSVCSLSHDCFMSRTIVSFPLVPRIC
jgi:predicted Ser/Thr protein kinase